jgi:hypothetical protein
MNNRFFLTALLSCFLMITTYGQEIDARLLTNKGQTAETAFKFNKNAYNYMLFELDHGYQLVEKKSLSKKERNSLVKLPENELVATQLSLIGTASFNYVSLGLTLKSQEKQFFQVGDNKVLVLLPISLITQLFIQDPSNTK